MALLTGALRLFGRTTNEARTPAGVEATTCCVQVGRAPPAMPRVSRYHLGLTTQHFMMKSGDGISGQHADMSI